MEKDIYKILDRMFSIYSHRDVHNIIVSFIDTLSSIVEEKDSYTYGHQKRTAKYALEIASYCNLDIEEEENLYLAATVHDIGKIRIPSELLMRPKLMDVEKKLIEKHAIVGSNLLKKIKYFDNIPTIVEQHHERIDGSGYPHGLKGDEIRKESKILAIADVIDAMLSHRPYRPALTVEQTIEELKINCGIKYCPQSTEHAIKILKNKDN